MAISINNSFGFSSVGTISGTTTATTYIINDPYNDLYSNYNTMAYPTTAPLNESVGRVLTFEEKLQKEIDDWLLIFKEN